MKTKDLLKNLINNRKGNTRIIKIGSGYYVAVPMIYMQGLNIKDKTYVKYDIDNKNNLIIIPQR